MDSKLMDVMLLFRLSKMLRRLSWKKYLIWSITCGRIYWMDIKRWDIVNYLSTEGHGSDSNLNGWAKRTGVNPGGLVEE
jgi:hypothetical protein